VAGVKSSEAVVDVPPGEKFWRANLCLDDSGEKIKLGPIVLSSITVVPPSIEVSSSPTMRSRTLSIKAIPIRCSVLRMRAVHEEETVDSSVWAVVIVRSSL
jgi:hypothetical protein